jgi:hypothetical protein
MNYLSFTLFVETEVADSFIIDLPTRPFYPAIAGNLKQLPVAVYFKQLPETAGFLRNCRFFLPEISVFNLLYFLKKKSVRSKTMPKFFLPLVNERCDNLSRQITLPNK